MWMRLPPTAPRRDLNRRRSRRIIIRRVIKVLIDLANHWCTEGSRWNIQQFFQTYCYRHQKKIFQYRTVLYTICLTSSAVRIYKGILFTFQVQTLPDLRNSYVPKRLAQVEFCARRNWVCIWSNTCAYITKSSWNPNTNTLEPDWPQHDRPAGCVIAQQYSSSTCVSRSFHSRKEKFGARLTNLVIYIYTYFLIKLLRPEIE